MSALEIVMISVASVLVFCIVLALVVLRYFRKHTANKASDFKFLDRFALENPVVFLGDSLTDFYPVNEFMPYGDILNRGIAANTTKDVENRLNEVLGLKPAAVFLQIGINDFIYQRKLAPEVLAERVLHIANELKAAGITVYIISLYPLNRKKVKINFVSIRHASNKKVLAANAFLADACEKEGFEFINVHDSLTDEEGNLKKEYTIEGLHITVQGYGVITKILSPYVTKAKGMDGSSVPE